MMYDKSLPKDFLRENEKAIFKRVTRDGQDLEGWVLPIEEDSYYSKEGLFYFLPLESRKVWVMRREEA
jgi:hypothetical protein